MTNAVCQPIYSMGQGVGILLSANNRSDFTFDKDALELLGVFASHAAIAVQNARLHQEEKRSREFLKSVVGDTSDPIVIMKLDRTIILWNSGAEALYGYTEAEALGRSVEFVIPDRERDVVEKALSRVLIEGSPLTFETQRRRKDATLVSVSATLSPVKDEAGGLVAIAAIYKDLSERKRAEEELQKAKAQAEAANRAKSEFLSNLNHELRSPLSAVIGFSDIILMESKDRETHRLVKRIREAGGYLLRLIEDLLDLDRIESGKMRLDLQTVSINRLVSAALDARRSHLPRDFTVESAVDEDCGLVTCDPTRIHQVLTNLLDNAIKYSPKGGTIRVRAERHPGEIWVSVQDEGMGIDPEEEKIIFERFRQLEAGHTRRAGGLGIGLSLVKHLLALHGGRIWVKSEKGRGSTFIFALPRAAEAGSPGPGEGADPWAGGTVLVVDDEEQHHAHLKLLMRSASRVIAAYNGEEGVEAARRERPDLILMDLRMPVMDGFEAIARLKAPPETRNIPVVVVSANPEKSSRERCFRLGAGGFVPKPVDPAVFRGEIERALAKAVVES